MKPNPLLVAVVAGTVGLGAGNAQAQASAWDPSWAFSGFGTVGYTRTNTDQADYVGPGQYGGVDKGGGISVDTRLGGQINAKANSVFSATLQALSQRNGWGNYRPSIEWAFIKAQATPDVALRAGRFGTSVYAVSDYQHVGYSLPWTHLPTEVYYQIPVSHLDGVDATLQHTFGGVTLTGQVYFGDAHGVISKLQSEVKNQIGLCVTAEFDNGITVHAGHVDAKLTVYNPALDNLVALLRTTPFREVGGEMADHGKKASFQGVSVGIDRDNWIGLVEYTQRKTEMYISDTNAWSATVGYHLGKFTPYAVYSKIRVVDKNVDNTIPPAVPLHAVIDQILTAFKVNQKTAAAGLRWDVWKNIDIKAQFDHVTPDHDVGTFQSAKPGFGNSAVNIYSVVADFVF